jgi:hypothetical protein
MSCVVVLMAKRKHTQKEFLNLIQKILNFEASTRSQIWGEKKRLKNFVKKKRDSKFLFFFFFVVFFANGNPKKILCRPCPLQKCQPWV